MIIQCTFSVSDWQETSVHAQQGIDLKQALVRYRYDGDIQGESVAQFSLAYTDESDASFSASEVIHGHYQGEPFNLILTHTGEHRAQVARGRCQVVYADGALHGFAGQGSYKADASTVKLTLSDH